MTGLVERIATTDGICRLTWNNLARQNAITDTMLLDLKQHLDQLATDRTCRVVVLQGAGDHFCAGRDVGSLEPGRGSDLQSKITLVHDVLTAIREFPRPVVSVVKGYCLGLGLGIVALCDIAIASEDARFGLPEVRLGIPPALTAVPLQQVIHPKWAAYLMYTAQRIDARKAEAIGLVTFTATPETLDAAADDCLRSLTGASPSAVAACKKFVRQSTDPNHFSAALELAVRITVDGAVTEDAVEGRLAFREKRAPVWA